MIAYAKFVNAVPLPGAGNTTEYSASAEKHKVRIFAHSKFPGLVIVGRNTEGDERRKFVPWTNVVHLDEVDDPTPEAKPAKPVREVA